MNLSSLHDFILPYYETYSLKVPSLMKSLEKIYRFDPDVIHISTPGPIGMLGLLAAKLMQVRTIGFYHTDFRLQAKEIVEDESVSVMLERFTRWFYSAMDEIKVPTGKYLQMLEERGFDPRKMSLFKRGINIDLFRPLQGFAHRDPHGDTPVASPVLLYVGRVSADKGIDFLIRVFRNLLINRPDLRLKIVGDGPILEQTKDKTVDLPVEFTGKLTHEALPATYSEADLFVFPSTTDTFGKAVLEAQACGLPAIVSSIGGPQEIIVPNRTGYIARAGNYLDWAEKIEHVISMREHEPDTYLRMRQAARAHAVAAFNNEYTLEQLFRSCASSPGDHEKKIA
jgi:glycosyltransferase involved in cell wall biosynthesis